MMGRAKYYIAGAYDPLRGAVGRLWLVLLVPDDYFHPGDMIRVNGKDYVLGKRDIDAGEVSSYELIIKSEVLEL